MAGVNKHEEKFYKRGLAIKIYYDGYHRSELEYWLFKDEEKNTPLGAVDSHLEGSYCLAKWKDVCRCL